MLFGSLTSVTDNIVRVVRSSGEYLLIQCHTPEEHRKLLNLTQTAIGESVKVKEVCLVVHVKKLAS